MAQSRNTTRPSDCGSESYHIAKYIDAYLNPLSQHHCIFIKDTRFCNHFFFKFTLILSLYTNIDTELGQRAVREALERFHDPTHPKNAILELHLGLT